MSSEKRYRLLSATCSPPPRTIDYLGTLLHLIELELGETRKS